MPTTPETWLPQFVVNTTTAGSQYDPDIIQLTNGNILVSWTSNNDTGAGSPAGTDVIGQIFDPFGALVGGEFRLNFSRNSDAERDATLAATDQGGFLVAYVDYESGAVNDYRVQLDRFGADGTFEAGVQVDLSTTSTRARRWPYRPPRRRWSPGSRTAQTMW